MEKFIKVTGIVAPMDRPNVDTDAIIPKQFLKSIKRSGFGPNAFDDWRYLDPGAPDIDNSTRRINPEFVLNQSPYDKATILIARENFGCGSSREHAVWALDDYGFRAVIAPSFADIFFNNSFKNGMLPIVLDAEIVEDLFNKVASKSGYELTVDLQKQKVITEEGEEYPFEVDAFRKHCLLNGLDDISLTLQHESEIKAYEEKTKQSAPWLF
ncbi:MAG: 3-isopropylmalate dehydratase small subunit [endosymbiont of Galathealinum brachiosum]|uniref:3-isopropylmalate dehydratase small subunit n=1 Tax=endosymbiont of Galathealinum brachiosum TaxID=2200906 RepID=A0A370DKD7_9GAMM|nr:MAG: 3-isopropylmalate dehydratase small subunit [endosymbiont of Galathealinum brachiosum]